MIEQPIEDPVLLRKLEGISADGMDLFLTKDGAHRIITLHATGLVSQMIANHQVYGEDAERLAIGYMLVLLAASTIKNPERVLLVSEVAPNGLVTEATGSGRVRGYLKQSDEDPGTIALMRYSESQDLLHHGRIEAVSEDLVENLSAYFNRSEQLETGITAGVARDEANRIVGAAAMFVQSLPGITEDREFSRLSDSMPAGGEIAGIFADGGTAGEMVRHRFREFEPRLVATRPAEFACHCSKDRFARFLSALPEGEKVDILENGPFPLRATCHNCNSTYRYERWELEELFTGKRTD